MSLSDFIELLNSFDVPVVDYCDEMLSDDLAFSKVLSDGKNGVEFYAYIP